MSEVAVPGLGFAVFDDTGVLYEHVSGVKDVISREPIDDRTAFEAASISKTLVAQIVLSLVDEGVLDLDAPLITLVSEVPEVAHDPRSARLTPRILLSHQGGLPNWRSRIIFGASDYSELFPPGDTLRFVGEPSADYRYSGEGYVLLQRVIEEVTGKGLNELARERIFEPLGMSRSSFLFDSEMRGNYSLGHDPEGAPDKWELNLALASSTLHTTAADLGAYGAHLAAEIRAGGLLSEMALPEVTLVAEGGMERSWGLGLGVVTAEPGRYIYHTGNNVIFIADFVYGIEENLGYVLLTNSARGQAIADELELRVFGHRLRS